MACAPATYRVLFSQRLTLDRRLGRVEAGTGETNAKTISQSSCY